eukprot:168962_1
MSTSVLFVFIIKVVTSQNATDACVWGRDESARDGINGQFIFQGYFSKAPWYKKQYGTDIRYMFLSNTRYVISGEEPVKGWPGLHAECATTGTSLYPWDCGLNWRVYAGQWTDDPDVYCQMGPCPEWECDAIITDIQYMGCDDIFPVKIRSNAWSNLNGDRYFYFDYPRFRWVCDESLTYSSTTSSLLAYSERTWIDTTKGSTVPILFSPFNQIQQIQCVQNIPTLSPVKKPDEPTSKTDEPSKRPSELPTVNPSRLPSIQPSAIPSFEQTATLTKASLRSGEVKEESTTFSPLHPNHKDSETTDKESVLLIVLVIAALCVCVLGLFVCNIFTRRNKINSDKDVANVSSAISELPQQRTQEEKKENVSAVQLQSTTAISLPGESQLLEIGVNLKTHRVEIMNEIQTLGGYANEGRGSTIEVNAVDDSAPNVITLDGHNVISQHIDDDFIVMGDDEITEGIGATLQ